MTTKKLISRCLLLVVLLFGFQQTYSCSTYKITVNGITLFGSNYDTWFIAPRIWFETEGYGCAFTGANSIGGNGFAPQAGMNEHGLVFASLAAATPNNGGPTPNKKAIGNRTLYLKDIMHRCKSVDEVKIYIEQYDHSVLSNDVFLYADSTGRYLVVEPYVMTLGNDDRYVLANFCPSTITDYSTIRQARYTNGTAFLKNKIDTSLAFCAALSDTMHVCREKIGDGTLLTSLWNLNDGTIHLYFYHDYRQPVQLNLKDELAKGDHSMEIPRLFAPNAEFKKLQEFKTPLNSTTVDVLLRFCFVLFLISAFFFLVSYLIKRTAIKFSTLRLLLFPLGLIMAYYMFLLGSEINIFYFPAPYTVSGSPIMNAFSYVPFLMLLLIIPLLSINIRLFINSSWGLIPKWILTVNNITYLLLIALFTYWGLYDVF